MPDEPKTTEQQLAEALAAIKQANEANTAMRTQIDNMQSQVTVISDENARLKGIVQTFGNEPPSEPKKSGMPDPVTQPEEYAKWITAQVRAEKNQEDAIRDQMKAVREAFYKQYPHLANHQPLVAYFSNEVLSENPQIAQAAGFAEVAKRCDEYIKGIITKPPTAPTPPHVGGGGANPPAPPAPPEPPSTPEGDLIDSIKDRNAVRDAKARPPQPPTK